MKCESCGKGVEAGPLHRVNPLGEIGRFRHEQCGGEPDPEIKDLVDLIRKQDNGDLKRTF